MKPSSPRQRSCLEMVFSDPNRPIRLNEFRSVLIRQEETIIFALIERAQFVRNDGVYETATSENSPIGELKNTIGTYKNFQGSFLDFMLLETEKVHAMVRRYTSPDEQPFSSIDALPEPVLQRLNYPSVLKPNAININARIKSLYLQKILPRVSKPGNDSTAYGSTATCDITALQSLSKRIHFGKFIAEAKFQENVELYTELIMNNDAEGIMKTLTDSVVEEKVLNRIRLKASTYGQDIDGTNEANTFKVNPQIIADVYKEFVIPLTKEVQVAYLLQRLEHPLVAYVGQEGSFAFSAAQKFFGSEAKSNFRPSKSIASVFGDVMANRVAFGVVPLEDSESGMNKESQQHLISTSLQVCAEVYVERDLVFSCSPSLQPLLHVDQVHDIMETCTRIYVPTFAERSLFVFLEQQFSSKEIVYVEGVEHAASKVSVEKDALALTSFDASRVAGLSVLPYQDSQDFILKGLSTVRYVVISKQLASVTGRDKTCICLNVENEAGSLFDALAILKKQAVNLSRIESLPCPRGDWKYDFFIEMDGHVSDANVSNALDELKTYTKTSVRCLGSYADAKT